jgi:hypothetical protein
VYLDRRKVKNTQMIRICGDLKAHVKEEWEDIDESAPNSEDEKIKLSDNIVVVQPDRSLETAAA